MFFLGLFLVSRFQVRFLTGLKDNFHIFRFAKWSVRLRHGCRKGIQLPRRLTGSAYRRTCNERRLYKRADLRDRLARDVWNARAVGRVTDNEQQKRFFMRRPVQDSI